MACADSISRSSVGLVGGCDGRRRSTAQPTQSTLAIFSTGHDEANRRTFLSEPLDDPALPLAPKQVAQPRQPTTPKRTDILTGDAISGCEAGRSEQHAQCHPNLPHARLLRDIQVLVG